MNRSDLLRRLDALRKMTEGRGCTEAEAATAAALASKLIEEYNISLAEVDFGAEGAQAVFREMPLTPPEIFNALYAVGKFCDAKVWKHRRASDEPVIQMAGLPSDLDLAEWLLGTISLAMTSGGMDLANALLIGDMEFERGHGRKKSLGIEEHTSAYRCGMAKRLSERLLELKAAQAPVRTSTGRDLVVVKAAAAEDYLRAHNIRLGTGRGITPSANGAFQAGIRAGEKVGLARPTSAARPLALGRR